MGTKLNLALRGGYGSDFPAPCHSLVINTHLHLGLLFLFDLCFNAFIHYLLINNNYYYDGRLPHFTYDSLINMHVCLFHL